MERAGEDGWRIAFDQPYGRHAKNWPQRVSNAVLVDSPAAGEVMVLDAWPGNPYGHVAYVESVQDRDHWTVTHTNMKAGKDASRVDGVTIRESQITRFPDGISFDDHTTRLKLIGFLRRKES